MHFLDPNQTYISKIRGGYLKDLVSQPKINPDLGLTFGQIRETQIQLSALDFFDFLGRDTKSDIKLNHGILSYSNNANNTILYISALEDPNELIYGVVLDSNNPNVNFEFAGLGWPASVNNTFGIEEFPTSTNDSDDIKNNILSFMKKWKFAIFEREEMETE